MKRKSLIIMNFICFLAVTVCCQIINTNDYSIDNADELAWKLNDDNRVTYNQIIPPYISGKLKIVSGKNSGVVVGVDEDFDGIWDEFIGIQTEKSYQLNEEIESGEILYASKLAIINSTKDERIYIIRLGSDEAGEIESKIPEDIRQKILMTLIGFGLHVHKGNRDFNEFVN